MIQWFGAVLLALPLYLWANTPSDSLSESHPQVTLLLTGGPAGPWYDLGVLQAVEKYRIPLNQLVTSGWGAWVGGLWAEGFSTSQIQKELQSIDSLGSSESQQETWISASGMPSLQMRWSLQDSRQGIVQLGSRKDASPSLVNELRLQKGFLGRALFPQSPARRLPWQVVLCDVATAMPVVSQTRALAPWVFRSIDLTASARSMPTYMPMENCGVFSPGLFPQTENQIWLYSSSWPERSDSLSNYPLRKQIKELRSQSDIHWIWMHPHQYSRNTTTPDSLMQLGFQSVRAALGKLRNWQLEPTPWDLPELDLASLKGVQIGYDDVGSEYQNHLSSFWPNGEAWQEALENFSRNVAQNGLYDSLSLQLVGQKNGELGDKEDTRIVLLALHASPLSQFEAKWGGWGSSILGAHAFAQSQIRIVDQYEYLFQLQGDYGESFKRFRPKLGVSGLQSSTLELALLFDVGKESYQRIWNRVEYDVKRQLLNVSYQDFAFDALWLQNPSRLWNFRMGMRSDEFRSEVTVEGFAEDKLTSEWVKTSTLKANLSVSNGKNNNGNPQPFVDSLYWTLQGGIHSSSLQIPGMSGAPLYGRWSLLAGGNYRWAPWFSLGAWTQAGLEGRLSEGKWEYPKEIELLPGDYLDASISNYWLGSMHPSIFSMTMPGDYWKSPHFALATANLGIHFPSGDGLWCYASFSRDFNASWNRLVLEPVFRFHKESLEILLGAHRVIDLETEINSIDFTPKGWKMIFQVGFFAL